MAFGDLSAQITRDAPFAPKREACIAPTLLPVCCTCRRIRDVKGSSLGLERWVTQRTYRKTHGVNPSDFPFTHTYCATCFTQFMDTLR